MKNKIQRINRHEKSKPVILSLIIDNMKIIIDFDLYYLSGLFLKKYWKFNANES